MKWIGKAIAGFLGGPIFTLIKPIADIFVKREDRKTATEVVKGRIALAKTEGHNEVTLKRAEWENIAVESTKDSWKDEYVTLIITSPIVLIIIGSLVAAFTGDYRMLEATTVALDKLTGLGLNMGEMMLYVVLAAIGIRGLTKMSR